MPAATIEVRKTYAADREVEIINAVHAAMMEGLKIPESEKNVRLIVHPPHRFAAPSDKEDLFTFISIDLIVGRSLDAKKTLYQAIVRNLERLDIPRNHVEIVLRDIPLEDWAVNGGVPASEVDLGFDLKV
ncbi:MAG: tautomerase family protein [Gammaproteobacteria bacterium]|nr:tautomerase family protein [Gammaproteobacteria bacterium]